MPTDTATIESTVFKALEEFGAEPETISREAGWEKLDVDSLDLAELAQIVEETYGVQIKGDDFKSLANVGDVIDFIAERA